MRILIVLFLLLISTLPTINGQAISAGGRFSYQKQLRVDGNVANTQLEDLFYNGSESIYVIYQKGKGADTLSSTDDKGEHKTVAAMSGVGDFTYYKNYKSRSMITREVVANGTLCVVRDTIPNIKWKLIPEKKQIGPYMCQKATATFRCANYVAWFTTAIPLSIGPWKLGGLPGLIVEMTNERNNATYSLLSADYPSSKIAYPIAPPQTKDPVYSFAVFATIQRKEQDRLRMFYKGSSTGNGQTEIKFNGPECYDMP